MNLQNQIDYLREIHELDLFDECSVPDGLDMLRVRSAIIMRCGLLTPIFSEPLTQRAATQQFFAENQWNFEHVVNILRAEYSPIENVTEWRDESATGEGKHITTRERNETETHSGTDSRTVNEGGERNLSDGGTTKTESTNNGKMSEGGSTTTESTISAENSATYQPDRKETVSHGKTEATDNTSGETVTHGKTEKEIDSRDVKDNFAHGEQIDTVGGESVTETESGDRGITMHRHGNIGVTTNQQMINEELDLLRRFNPYKFIADLYENALMIGLY